MRREKGSSESFSFSTALAIIATMISTLLLIVIYIAFISLGLPDSLLGASWPMMHTSLGFDVSNLGYISFTICMGTVISSISYSRLSSRYRTEHITTVSVILTALSLYAFAFLANSFTVFPIALLLGLGAGSVDAGLNYYVALHYKARHMSWLHAFWGLGTTFGPTVLALFFASGRTWNDAYLLMAAVQSLIVLLLLISLPLWKKNEGSSKKVEDVEIKREKSSIADTLRIKGAPIVLLSFFLYCAIESTMLNWSASFTVFSKGLTESQGAQIASFIYWGMTVGRFLTGAFNEKTGDRFMIAAGLILSLLGALALILSTSFIMIAVSVFLVGLGFAPVYPSLLHQTPSIFGMDDAQKIMGLEMASAYIGSSVTPFLFGVISRFTGEGLLPYVLIAFVLLEIMAASMKRKLARS